MSPTTVVHRSAWRDLDPDLAHAVLKLRVDVFVVEQACPYPELDGRDVEPATEHVWVAGDAPAEVLAYLRVLADPAGRRIGRVVTAPDARGRGLAGTLLDDVLERHGREVLVLDAQAHLAAWYGRYGFERSGDDFVEDGIPHVPMRRDPLRSGLQQLHQL